MIAVAELEQNERKIIKLFYNFEEVPGIDRDDELLSLARYKVIKKTFICKNLLKVWFFYPSLHTNLLIGLLSYST